MAVLSTEFDAEESKCVPYIIEFILNCMCLARTVLIIYYIWLPNNRRHLGLVVHCRCTWHPFSFSGYLFLLRGWSVLLTFMIPRFSSKDIVGFSGDYCKVHQALSVLSYLNGSICQYSRHFYVNWFINCFNPDATLNFFVLVIPLTKCILRRCTHVQQAPNPLYRSPTTHRDPQSHTRVRQDPQPPPRIYHDPQGAHADGPASGIPGFAMEHYKALYSTVAPYHGSLVI